MDQAKFKVPRNMEMSKAIDGLWRPQLHFTGCIAHGIGELYYTLDADVTKDSNTQRTILMLALEKCAEILERRNMCLPPDLLLHALPKICPDVKNQQKQQQQMQQGSIRG
jgi:hypothetical protein